MAHNALEAAQLMVQTFKPKEISEMIMSMVVKCSNADPEFLPKLLVKLNQYNETHADNQTLEQQKEDAQDEVDKRQKKAINTVARGCGVVVGMMISLALGISICIFLVKWALQF